MLYKGTTLDNYLKCNFKNIVGKCRNKWHISIISIKTIALANLKLLMSTWNEIYRLFRDGTLMIISIS